jgi:3-methyladenine DNA glycosylase Tag
MRKGGEAALMTLLGPAPGNAALESMQDDRILSAMTRRIFSAGFVWSAIETKWPGFEEAFLGFELQALLFQQDEFWHDLASDKRIVRNGAKIVSVRDNAAFVHRTSQEYGTFGKFLGVWPADDQVGLLAHLAKYASRLGGATGQFFLRWLGWDCYVTGPDFVAALRDAGLDIAESPTSKRDLTRIQTQLNAWRTETGLPYRHLSRILSMSIGPNRSVEELLAHMAD